MDAGTVLKWLGGGIFCLLFCYLFLDRFLFARRLDALLFGRPLRRLAELLETLRRSGLEPKRLRLVQHDAASAPSLLLLESRRGGRPGLAVEPTLLLRDADGRETDETRRIYFRDKE